MLLIFIISEKILVQSSIDCDILSDITDLRYPKGIHEVYEYKYILID